MAAPVTQSKAITREIFTAPGTTCCTDLPVLLLASTCALGGVTTTVVDIPTRGVNQRFLYVHPDAPKANIVDLFGGTGSLGIQDDGSFSNPAAYCNPVARNLQAFADHGYAIALVDATSDGRVRNYPDVLEVINYLHAHDNVPTWVIGGDLSTKGAANIVGQLPVSYPAGVVFHAPDTVDASILALVKRPSLVVWHGLDTAQFGAALYAGLTAAPTKEQIILSGGSNAGCGYHRFNGADAEFAAGIAGFIDRINPTLVGIASYQGLFYNAPAESESGWGINFAHQGDTLFASWFTYDAAGRGSWFVVTANKTAPGTYGGKLYTTRGPAFNALPWDPSIVVATEAGTATFAFTDADNGTFNYVIGAVNQTKKLVRQTFGPRPTCSFGTVADLTTATNFQDLWWKKPASSESGWGINLTHQGDTIFASWFTYDLDGTPLWLVVTAPKTNPSVYSGDLYQTSGPRFDAFDRSKVVTAKVGAATFTFADGNNATFDYTVQLAGMAAPVMQSKAITREVFTAPGTTCK